MAEPTHTVRLSTRQLSVTMGALAVISELSRGPLGLDGRDALEALCEQTDVDPAPLRRSVWVTIGKRWWKWWWKWWGWR